MVHGKGVNNENRPSMRPSSLFIRKSMDCSTGQRFFILCETKLFFYYIPREPDFNFQRIAGEIFMTRHYPSRIFQKNLRADSY